MTNPNQAAEAPADFENSASAAAKARLLCVGEALVDRVITADSTTDVVGGSLLNVACGLARLEHPTYLAAWWGNDDYGRAITAHLQERGVHPVPGSDRAPASTVAYAKIDDAGHATYTFDLHWQLPDGFSVQDFSHLHTGSIAAVLDSPAFHISEAGASDSAPVADASAGPVGKPAEASGETGWASEINGPIWKAAAELAEHGTVSYDPNVRPSIMGSPEQARPIVEAYLQVANLVKASDEDIEWLYPGQDPLEVAREWTRRGPSLVVVTRGGEGATAFLSACPENPLTVAPGDVEVADTVGAGDSFMAGLISGLLDAGLLGSKEAGSRLAQAGLADIRPALERASATSAVTVSHAGAYSPTRSEL